MIFFWCLVNSAICLFLSIDLVKLALGEFNLGQAAAMSLVYFLIILLFSWIFYTVMTNREAGN